MQVGYAVTFGAVDGVANAQAEVASEQVPRGACRVQLVDQYQGRDVVLYWATVLVRSGHEALPRYGVEVSGGAVKTGRHLMAAGEDRVAAVAARLVDLDDAVAKDQRPAV